MTEPDEAGSLPAESAAPHMDVALAAKVAFLERPSTYPDAPETVETIETHFAYVFLSRRQVYKLKKPVTHGQIDYATRAARRAACELEVALNRRLAASVYLGVVPLTSNQRGLALDGDGAVVDWLVQMLKLPRDRTLDVLARNGGLTDADLHALIDKLHSFYRRSAVAPWSRERYRQRLGRAADGAANELIEPSIGLDANLIRQVRARQQAFLQDSADLVDSRVRNGRIVDAHGDLRPEHVFFDGEPQIIDCLEFSQELRWLDAAEEIGFLALELERIGAERVGERLLELYVEIAKDPVRPELLAFYRAQRALLRAVLAAWRARQAPPGADRERWRKRAAWYIAAAADAFG